MTGHTSSRIIIFRNTRQNLKIQNPNFYLFEGVHDYAGVGAVVHEDGGGAHPRLEVVQAEWDVLGVVAVEDPDLSVGGGLGHSVPVVVEQNPLLASVAAQAGGEAPHLFQGRVQTL